MFGSTYKQKQISLAGLLGLAVLSAALSGCGKDEFVDQKFSSSVAAQGYQLIPAKVDLLIVVDNTPSFAFPYSSLQSALPALVQSLASQGWNYHIAAMPMVSAGATSTSYAAPSIGSVLVDSSMNYQYAPYTGLPNPDYVPNAITNAAQLNLSFPTNTSIGSSEQSFRGIRDAIASENKNFLRDDALFAMVVISNGDDLSSGTVAQWVDSIRIAAGKSTTSSMRLYPIVAQSNDWTRSCFSAVANTGTRYLSAASSLQVPLLPQFHVCSNSNMSTLVQTVASQLQVTKQAFITSAIVLDKEPNLGSIKVYKNGALVNRDTGHTNGWDYLGYSATPVPTITSPYNNNYSSGWIIQLYGNGQAIGSDQLNIEWTQK